MPRTSLGEITFGSVLRFRRECTHCTSTSHKQFPTASCVQLCMDYTCHSTESPVSIRRTQLVAPVNGDSSCSRVLQVYQVLWRQDFVIFVHSAIFVGILDG